MVSPLLSRLATGCLPHSSSLPSSHCLVSSAGVLRLEPFPLEHQHIPFSMIQSGAHSKFITPPHSLRSHVSSRPCRRRRSTSGISQSTRLSSPPQRRGQRQWCLSRASSSQGIQPPRSHHAPAPECLFQLDYFSIDYFSLIHGLSIVLSLCNLSRPACFWA